MRSQELTRDLLCEYCVIFKVENIHSICDGLTNEFSGIGRFAADVRWDNLLDLCAARSVIMLGNKLNEFACHCKRDIIVPHAL